MPSAAALDRHFPRYRGHDPLVPVWCVTPDRDGCFHRFFDTDAISPDGRRLACLRMPFEDRANRPGDAAEVVVVDLEDGGSRVVATTRGWEQQMGANLNWSGDDNLAFNDVDAEAWTPQLVRLNVDTGEKKVVDGAGVYHVSPDGRTAAASSMEKMRRTQGGYGVLVPDENSRRNVGAVDDDGLWFTDLHTGGRRLILSIADAVKAIPELRDLDEAGLREWEVYGFHAKWNPQGDRLIWTIRRYRNNGENRFNAFSRSGEGEGVRFDVLTLRPDGTDVHDAVPAERWEHGGHHINFFPDGRALSANVRLPGEAELSLVRCDLDGGNFGKLTEKTIGSGHPTVHPDGRHVLTDTYQHESLAFGDGSVPLRWIDRGSDTERVAVRAMSRVGQTGGVLRVDAHPAWDRTWRWTTFNGVSGTGDGTRRVFVADFGPLLGL